MVELLSLEALSSGLGAFAAMMLYEGLIKRVAIRSWDQLVGAGMEALPRLYELTDPLIPDWLYSGENVEAAARDRYEALTGVRLPDRVMAEWRRRLDLQKVADLFPPAD